VQETKLRMYNIGRPCATFSFEGDNPIKRRFKVSDVSQLSFVYMQVDITSLQLYIHTYIS
jgi:hypothetical protein